MTDHRIIGWTDATARLQSFTTSSKGKDTTVRIELKVTDPRELSHLIRELAEIKATQGTITVDVEEHPFRTGGDAPGTGLLDRDPGVYLPAPKVSIRGPRK